MNYGISDILTLLGSLGLFLYGMKVMSDALINLAGDRLRSILAAATSNRFFAMLTGLMITAAIQSSSATTLMVVSFVNAGLFQLTEAVGIIMGANVGTTVTAWLISILGFKVKISAAALPLVGIGFLLSLSAIDKRKHFGLFLVGFAMLFLGLDFLKDSVPDIGHHPETLAFLTEYSSMGFYSILLFFLIGALLTLIVQSSSAAMALTLLMTHEGWVSFDMAAAMVLGQNIGTTITAILASLIANFQAKRAAVAHLIFNLLGVIWVLIVFNPFIKIVAQLVEDIEGASPLTDTLAVPVALSLFHSVFNIINALVLIGFIPLIVRLVKRLVPETKREAMAIDQPRYLNDDALKYSQTAIKALSDESLRLLQNTAYKVISHGMSVHRKDLESDHKLKEILETSGYIAIDIDQVYHSKIKNIYSRILEYATQVQSKNALTESEIETVRNILIANRMLVQVIKTIKPSANT
jgi:phosphate:Na+ symporter